MSYMYTNSIELVPRFGLLLSPRPNVVAEDCTHFYSTICMGKNEKSEVGTEVGKGVKKNPTQIWPYWSQIWPYWCGILFNSFPNVPPLRDCHGYVY